MTEVNHNHAIVSLLVRQGGQERSYLMPNVVGIGVDYGPNGTFAMHCVAEKDEHGQRLYADTEEVKDNVALPPDDELRKTLEFLQLVYGHDAVDDALDWMEEHSEKGP